MKFYVYPVAASIALALAACGTPPKQPDEAEAPTRQLDLQLASGMYNCERGVRIKVEREVPTQGRQHLNIDWKGATYRLERDSSRSGLPRFESPDSGLIWIDLPWKSLLLDAKTNTTLANECRPG